MKFSRSMTTIVAGLSAMLLVTSCASGDGDNGQSDAAGGESNGENQSLVLYSGRDEQLIQPMIDKFEEETGVNVDVRYGSSAEMAAQLAEEGESTPADVFYSQEVGAVGALAQRDLLGDLSEESVNRVEERFRPADGTKWVGVTARSRVIAYNPQALGDAEAPNKTTDLVEEQYKDKVAVVPGNAGFQAAITGFRASAGDEAAGKWLDDMTANGVDKSFEKNGDLLESINNGDTPIGLINHYYWSRQDQADQDKAKLVFPEEDDPGALVNATAAGITKKGADNPNSQKLIDFLLSDEGQKAFVDETWEYPVVPGVANPEGIPALDELKGPEIDLTDLDSLEQTQELLTEKGYIS